MGAPERRNLGMQTLSEATAILETEPARGLELLKKFDVDLHTLLDAIVGNGPAGDQAVVDFANFDAHDELPSILL